MTFSLNQIGSARKKTAVPLRNLGINFNKDFVYDLDL